MHAVEQFSTSSSDMHLPANGAVHASTGKRFQCEDQKTQEGAMQMQA